MQRTAGARWCQVKGVTVGDAPAAADPQRWVDDTVAIGDAHDLPRYKSDLDGRADYLFKALGAAKVDSHDCDQRGLRLDAVIHTCALAF
jgi:hypothetical protein